MAGVSFNWDSYQQAPDAGGLTGQPLTLDPSQPGNANVWGTTPGGTYSPFGGSTGTPTPSSGFTYTSGPNAGVNVPSAAPGSTLNNGGISPAPPSAGGTQDPQAFFNQLFPGTTLTPQMLADNEAALNAQGIKIIRNAEGQPSKIQLPDGSVVDPIIGAGSGQNQKAWNVVAGPGGAATGGDTSGYGSLNGLNAGFMTSPIGQFTPPSYQDALNDPGAQYAINEAERGMQNNAAARGTLLNGRVLQAENNAILGDANTLYGDIYNRAANTYGINFNTQTRNQDAPFQKYYQLSSLGQQAAAAS